MANNSVGSRARAALGRNSIQTGIGRLGWEGVLQQRSPHPARAVKADPISGRAISERGMQSFSAPARGVPGRVTFDAPSDGGSFSFRQRIQRNRPKRAASGGILQDLAGQMLSGAGGR